MSLFHESLTRLLSGATLTGFLSPSDDQNPKAVSVLVKQLEKSGSSHQWQFQLLMTPGGNGQACSIIADVHWAGSTPVVSLHDVEIPDVGLINGKVLIHNGLFAGTWVYEGAKGQAWGEIVSPTTPPPPKQFVIERSSEFLREWWTGTDWSNDYAQATWYEHEPDGPRVTADEAAHSVFYPDGKMDAG